MSQIIRVTTAPAGYGINYGANSNNPPAGRASSMGGRGVDGVEQAIQAAQGYFFFNPATDDIYVNGVLRYDNKTTAVISGAEAAAKELLYKRIDRQKAGQQAYAKTTMLIKAPVPIPVKAAPTPSQGSISSSELCNPSSPYYVGDVAAKSPGGCFTPGYKDGGATPLPTAAPDPIPVKEGGKKCPKGASYDTSKYIGELDPSLCDSGYYATNPGFMSPQRCICNSASKAEQEQAKGADGSGGAGGGFGDLMKMLPQLLMVMVIVSIISAFRK